MVMSVREIDRFLEQWEMDTRDLHRRMILAPTPRERERWHAVWLLAQGWTAWSTAEALGRDPPHHRPVGRCLRGGRSGGPDIRADRRFPPALGEAEQAALTGAVQELPGAAGIEMANWNWRVVNRFVWERRGISLSRSSCLTPYQVRGDVTGCTGWASPSSVPRNGCSRRMRSGGSPSWRSMPH